MAKRQSMTERVLQELRNDIINWNYEENDMITEAEISEKFGVSKTPSREALNYLCMEGFLEKIPNKGYLVKGISVTELQSLFQFRGVLPSLTVRREKNGYKPSKYGRCSRFLSCINMCYISGLFKIFVFLMIVRIEAFVMIS